MFKIESSQLYKCQKWNIKTYIIVEIVTMVTTIIQVRVFNFYLESNFFSLRCIWGFNFNTFGCVWLTNMTWVELVLYTNSMFGPPILSVGGRVELVYILTSALPPSNVFSAPIILATTKNYCGNTLLTNFILQQPHPLTTP